MVAQTDVPHTIESEVPHTFEMTKVPHPSETKAITTIGVTSHIVIEAPTLHMATEALDTNDMEVTPPIDTNVTTPHETYVTAPDSTNPSVNTDGWFLGGPNDQSILIGYADHMAFEL